MAKLPRKISGKDLLKVFGKLGFEVERQRGSHAFLRHPDGRRLTIPVYDEMPVNLLVWTARLDLGRSKYFTRSVSSAHQVESSKLDWWGGRVLPEKSGMSASIQPQNETF